MKIHKLRIASFGFRSVPPTEGSAGADKFALELLTRIADKGHHVVAYNRLYSKTNKKELPGTFKGIRIKYFRTINRKGFDSLFHSFLCTFHIIFSNNADIIHIHNGGNSIWGLFLRLFNKKVFVSQDGLDWQRDKWPWYAKLYLKAASFTAAYIPNKLIFDNTFAKEHFEKKFNRMFNYIPYGSEVPDVEPDDTIFNKLNIQRKEYYLFVGRFIPDKGIHYLIEAFERLKTEKKLVLVGGSPNPSDYEIQIMSTEDERIVFPGYIYGDDTIRLMKDAYAYVQPSDVEGLSPVILTVMGLGTPLVCSDIPENMFIAKGFSFVFSSGNVESLYTTLVKTLYEYDNLVEFSKNGKKSITNKYTWNSVVNQHISLFSEHNTN